MTAEEQYLRVKEIFLEAVEVPLEELDAFLVGVCDDEQVIEEVRSLVLLENQMTVGFLEESTPLTLGGSALVEVGGRAPVDDLAADDKLPFPGWDRYTLVERIGYGGMAEVFKAVDPRLKRHVAIKLLRVGSKQQERFVREAEAQARVAHANVLEVYETGEVEGRRFIAMRHIDGPILSETRQQTTMEEKIRIMLQVAEAIHAAHRQGLIHRDVKPSNILVERTDDGVLKAYVADFGIAAEMEGPGLTATGEMIGTPTYMAPEQISGGAGRLDRRTDIYGLGVTMYEYLSGQRPFDSNNPIEILAWLREGDPRPLRQVAPALPGDLETIVMKCLEREPQRRYPSARALAEDLARYLDGEPIKARRPTLSYRLVKQVRRHRAVVAVSFIALVALLVMVVLNLQVRQQSYLREELARDFARRVTEMELAMRMAHTAPLHNLQREEEAVHGMMAAIRERLEETELLGEGSGHYAQGRGYMALGEYRRARESLERARSQGYHHVGVACGLGRVLAELYLEQAAAAMLIEPPDERAERWADLDTSFRKPALVHLQFCSRAGAKTGAEEPEHIDALIALLEQRHDDALALARDGYQRLPWLYESIKLEADVQASWGFDAWLDQHPDEALIRWTAAVASYQSAAAVARSDPSVYLGLCRFGRIVGGITPPDTEGLRQLLQAGLDACEQALRADPHTSAASQSAAALQTMLAGIDSGH